MTPADIKQLRGAYKTVFGSDEGGRVLEDLRKRCHARSSTFSTEPNETYFFEGQRQVVLFIEDMLAEEDTRKLPTTAT